MKTLFSIIVVLLTTLSAMSQTSYKDSLQKFITEYINTHEVITGEDRKSLQFFPIDQKYRINAKFQKEPSSRWFDMETSGILPQVYRVYGTIDFELDGVPVKLNIYQSQRLSVMDQYKDHLFLPFTDLTSGESSYATGRYIDIDLTDIVNGRLTIDFNKAYNPYCAYVSGKYNCPIPPKENNLPIAIPAGEKNYAK